MHAQVIAAGGELADGHWITRNRKIVERCLADPRAIRARTIVFAFDGDHKYAIEDELKARSLIVKDVRQLFSAAETPEVPTMAAAVKRWQKNLQRLRAALSDAKTDSQTRDLIVGLKREEELTLFIRAFAEPVTGSQLPRD